ncbi:MAG: PAS domain S-box protein [Thermoguttaceae bacterium]
MNQSSESAFRQIHDELSAIYDRSTEGILVIDPDTRRLVRANRAMSDFLGYAESELLSLSVDDIHPAKVMPDVVQVFADLRRGHPRSARNLVCRRKDGSLIRADVAACRLGDEPRSMILGLFHDATAQNRANELLRASEQRHRMIADNVDDMVWTVSLNLSDDEKVRAMTDTEAVVDAVLKRWRFSFVSSAAERVFGYAPSEVAGLSLRDITTEATFLKIRETMIRNVTDHFPTLDATAPQHVFEGQFLAKTSSPRWCEVVSAYLRDDDGMPTDLIGITRDITNRRAAERALRESESTLRGLFENLPDVVLMVDRAGIIRFANRGIGEIDRAGMLGGSGFQLLIPEHHPCVAEAIRRVFADGTLQRCDCQDIFGCWWACRIIAPPKDGDSQLATVIATDVTQRRMAAEAIQKEQQLLRRLLDLHERERQLTAYDIHDGFAQELTGALFRLQAFREAHAKRPETAWKDFDSAVRLLGRAIDEARRLISGLRPPVLDESGIVQAIEYLVCERATLDGPEVKFVHDVAFERLAPPLESTVFRIVQESLQNACRHSHSDKVRIELVQRGRRIHIDVRDWGVGFRTDQVEEQRFGLQGIRERVRLLKGCVEIESAPGQGAHIHVELPMVDRDGDVADASGPTDNSTKP